jgi:hypothetical protein
MKITLSTAVAAISLALVAGCASDYRPARTGLELQAFQKREFETTKRIAFAATLSVFQDLGYIVGSADLDTGFVTAKSPTQSKSGLFTMTVMTDTKATAFVEELRPNSASIRLSFVNGKEECNGYGSKQVTEQPVEDPKTYEEVFTKIQQAIFIRSQTK